LSNSKNKESKIDIAEFEKIFKLYFTQLTAYALKYTKDLDSAKEIVHTVFVNTWEKRVSLKAELNIRSYLYTSVYNRCLNYIRDNKKTVAIDESFANTLPAEAQATLENTELQTRIDAIIESLPNRCRQIFILSRYEELKYSGIAERLNISVKTVEAQMSKALKILRQHLAEFLTLMTILFIWK